MYQIYQIVDMYPCLDMKRDQMNESGVVSYKSSSLSSKTSSLTCNKECISHAACVVTTHECDVEESDVEEYESSEEAASCS
jgi:hypothetical protein